MFSNATKVFIISMLAVPITYFFNYFMLKLKWDQAHPLWLIGSVVVVLLLVLATIILQTKDSPPILKSTEYIQFCVLSILSFTGVVSLITGLELDGMISGFMGAFLRTGEPYLRSGHGVLISYWHGTAMYAMYLMMTAALSWNNSFHEVALFWAGSIGNSVVVTGLAVLLGKHGLSWGSILYLPFLMAPFVLLRKTQASSPSPSLIPAASRWQIVLTLSYLLLSFLLHFIRALVVLESQLHLPHSYAVLVEPYLLLKDPAPFPRIQMLVNLFYLSGLTYLPIGYGLLSDSPPPWLWELSLVHAGAALQGQMTHMGASMHPRTPYVFRVSPDLGPRLVFWTVNLTLAVGPQLLAWSLAPSAKSHEP